MTATGDVSDKDRDMFRQAVGEVKPIKQDIYHSDKPKPKPKPKSKPVLQQRHTGTSDKRQAIVVATPPPAEISGNDRMEYRKDGVQKKAMEKLRRGKIVIQAELDLHGVSVAMLENKLHNFLYDCQSQGYIYTRIIHGKGYGSVNKMPVLKNHLNRSLRSNSAVLAFCSAPINSGGTGAVHVKLKKLQSTDQRY